MKKRRLLKLLSATFSVMAGLNGCNISSLAICVNPAGGFQQLLGNAVFASMRGSQSKKSRT